MPKAHTEFVCHECGYRSPRSLGRCPECDTWGSLAPAQQAHANAGPRPLAVAAQPVRLADIPHAEFQRIPVGEGELSRVLGGGIVPGSLTLIGGDPGVGKSTLLSQLANQVALANGPVLYASGEESLAQVGMRARRMRLDAPDLLLLSETDIDAILASTAQVQPRLLVLDSIQSVMAADVESLPGSVAQLRECALRCLHAAKSSGTAIVLVGHVTKDGSIAGPKVLEHMVDTVLYLEGERLLRYRLLRSVKNRFGATNEVGVFEMRGEGLVEVPNPSAVFLEGRAEAAPGSVVTVALEGTRPILGEIQGLASRTTLAVPRRTANGFDANRLHLVTAVLSRRLGLPLHDQDVYLNVVGGLRIDEPAADLAAALAVMSSLRDHALPTDLVALGEIGLSGELRTVGQLDIRLREAAKLGFLRAIVPRAADAPRGLELELIAVGSVREAARELKL